MIFTLLSCKEPLTDQAENYSAFTNSILHNYRYSWISDTRVKQIPDINAEGFLLLNEGQVIQLTGVASNNRFKTVIRGIEFNAPYVQVLTQDNSKGWVYEPTLKKLDVITIKSNDQSIETYNSLVEYLDNKYERTSFSQNSISCDDPLGNCLNKDDSVFIKYGEEIDLETHLFYESRAASGIFKNKSIEEVFEMISKAHAPLYGIDLPDNSSVLDINTKNRQWSGYISIERNNQRIDKIYISGTTDGDYYNITLIQNEENVEYSFEKGI